MGGINRYYSWLLPLLFKLVSCYAFQDRLASSYSTGVLEPAGPILLNDSALLWWPILLKEMSYLRWWPILFLLTLSYGQGMPYLKW